MAGVRGASWHHRETLELLALWGEAKVQQELSSSTRNIEVYRDISSGLVAKGFRRSAEECRNKTKKLRLAFKKVVANNEQSGAALETCPFYTELSHIFGRSASVTGRRLSHSFEEMEAPSTSTIIRAPSLPPQKPLRIFSPWTKREKAEAGAENNAEGDMEELPPGEDLAPGAILRELSPKSRLAYVRARTKRVSAVQKFSEEMIRHSTRQRELLLEASRREHEEFMNVMKASIEEERQTWELLGGILQGTLVALQDLTQVIRGQGGAAASQAGSTSAAPPE
ncbi:UNVERIFIED_CONTAM: hypothetical protein K2H54_065597 [Gekko kuhli]